MLPSAGAFKKSVVNAQVCHSPPLYKQERSFLGNAELLGAFVDQSWSMWSGRVRFSAGLRWDQQSIDKVSAVSPQAAVSFGLTTTTRLQLGWGQAVQYPLVSQLLSPFGNRDLLPARSTHVVAALEQRLRSRMRLRVEVFNRSDRDLTFQSFLDPRILNGQIFTPPLDPLYYNSLRGRARGAEIFLQRSSANRFTGWVSYAYGHTVMHDGVSDQSFAADYDQRHTVNLYGGFRVTPTVNISLHSSYGSGFPTPGYLERNSHGFYVLADTRNQLRLPAYFRTDLRVNKTWARSKLKYTLYAELINLTDHTNEFFLTFNNYNSQGIASVTIDKSFPILPSGGFAVDW
jgi:outer membrane receptor for ferrienterochelin and colicin